MSKSWKDIEASRNRRLWITSVVVPVTSSLVLLYSNPEFKKDVVTAVTKVKDWTKDKYLKLKEKKEKEAE